MINFSVIPPEVLIKNVEQYLSTQYTHKWLNELQTTTGKLRTFRQVKYTFKYESYLDLPFHLYSAITRLRISNHNLKIETGRYNLPPLPVNERGVIILRNGIFRGIIFRNGTIFYCFNRYIYYPSAVPYM